MQTCSTKRDVVPEVLLDRIRPGFVLVAASLVVPVRNYALTFISRQMLTRVSRDREREKCLEHMYYVTLGLGSSMVVQGFLWVWLSYFRDE